MFLEAILAYWNWAYQYEVYQIYVSGLNLANNRFNMVKKSYLQGDKPAVDTLESIIQIQNRSIQLDQAQIDIQNARLVLSNFLWLEDLTPLEVAENLRPEKLTPMSNISVEKPNASFLQNLVQTHPELKRITIKQTQLDIKEKLKREQFKPQLTINYNLLGDRFNWSGPDTENSYVNDLITENYKLGVSFRYPLMLRKERGGLELVKLEQLDYSLKLKSKELQLSNKIQAIYQEWEITRTQLNTLGNMLGNYQALLQAETEKFRIGESSVFLLNSREQKLIEAQLKLRKLEMNMEKLRWKLLWARGELR